MSRGPRGGLGLLGWFTLALLLVLAVGMRNRLAWLLLLVYLVLSRVALMRDRAARERASTRAGGTARSEPAGPTGSVGGARPGGGARDWPGGASAGAGAAAGQATPRKTPHEVLGVPTDARPDAIRTAYLDLVRQYHPDRVASLGPELRAVAEARMREINAAYEALGGRGATR